VSKRCDRRRLSRRSAEGGRRNATLGRGEENAAVPRRSGGRSGRVGGSNSVVESQPSKLLVAGSIPVSRSNFVRGTSSRRTPYRRRSAGAPGPRLRSGGALASLAPCAGSLHWCWCAGTWEWIGAVVDKAQGPGGTKSPRLKSQADVAQLAERVLGKDEVTGSIPVIGSIRLRARRSGASARCLAEAPKERRPGILRSPDI